MRSRRVLRNNLLTLGVSSAVILFSTVTANGDFIGLQFVHHATVQTLQGQKKVYRLYAKFSNGGDKLLAWSGSTQHPTLVQTVCGTNFFNPVGAGTNTAPYQEEIDTNPDVQWGTFATIGVSIGDQGSGDKPAPPDETGLTAGFP